MRISDLSKENIRLTRNIYNQNETAWSFEISPFLNESISLKQAYENWQDLVTKDFLQLHANEEELNFIFIDTYKLHDEITPEVPFNDISILHGEINRNELDDLELVFREQREEAINLPFRKDVVMQQFISYSIGCMMGRYRMDIPGLHIAHPNPSNEEVRKYSYNGSSFEIDDDAIIPLMGNNCQFSDDAVNRLNHFIEIIWGVEKLTENINFLQECLNKDIEVYFTKHFWNDHYHTYKKKPIYWLFASKGNAFQVLVYMHRMNRFTVEKIRTKYLLPHIQNLQSEISLMEDKSPSISSDDARKLDKLRSDLFESQEYDLELKDRAEQQIEIDLDDGVTENYKLFEGVVAKIK